MEIFYLSRSILPSKAANSVHVMKMCQALAQNGHIVTLVAAGLAKITSADIFNYYGVENIFNIKLLKGRTDKALGLLLYLVNFYQYIKKIEAPDLFYSRDLFTSTAATFLFNIPFIYEAHKPPTTFVHSYLTRRMLKNKNLQKLVVITNSLKKEYLRLFPSFLEEKIVVAPDGADIPNTQGYKMVAKNDKDKLIIGYVGSLYPGRGMEIIHAVAKALPQYDFHIVGGSAKDIAYWKNRCEDINNIYFKGFVPHGELHRYYAEIDIVLAPYQSKVAISGGRGNTVRWMSPLKIFEYMAFTKPIITSDLPVLKEILTDRYSALLCNPSCPEEWVNSVKMLADQKMRTQIAVNAFELLRKHYTWGQRVGKILNKFR